MNITSAQKPRCLNCLYYDTTRTPIMDGQLLFGECRRRSPKHGTINGLDAPSWPNVAPEMWCGEHAWKVITGDERRNSIGDPKLWRELNYGETIKQGDERLEGTVWHPVRYEECDDTKYFGGKPHRRAI
tara:strand:- start:153 stop:539 length:387 start_codon:yes stop_codon:yes gene_type:complete